MTKEVRIETVKTVSAQATPRLSLNAVRWRAARPMVIAAVLISTVYLTLSAIVISVDPHNVYSWGAEPRLEPGNTPRDLVIDWIDVAAKDPEYNTFLVGSSITAMYTPEYMKDILGPDARMANLSYGGPRPRDRDLVLGRLVDHPNVRHVILTFDWTYIQNPDVTNSAFPTFLYDDDITNDLRMVNLPTIRRTFGILGGELTYSNPDDERYAKYTSSMNTEFQSSSEMARIERMIERSRTGIGAASGRDCASFRAINEQLVPDVKALAARGVQVDILFPIVSYAFYYVRQNDISPTLLDEQMTARRCLVDAVGDLANVRIFALDDEPDVAGDLANFREVGHVYDPDILRRYVSAVKTGSDRLTSANVAKYETDIRSSVEGYRLTNSNMVRESTGSNR